MLYKSTWKVPLWATYKLSDLAMKLNANLWLCNKQVSYKAMLQV